MGDISEIRGLLSLISFVGMLILLIGLIPSQFVVEGYEGREHEVPNYFDSIDLIQYAETYVMNITDTDIKSEVGDYYFKDLDIGGHDLEIGYSKANKSHHKMWVTHYWSEWLFVPWDCTLLWYDKNGTKCSIKEGATEYVTGTIIESDYNEYVGAEYGLTHPNRFSMEMTVYYNTSAYSNVNEAWDNYDLHILTGITWDQVATGYSAFDLIGMILFFQLPNVHWYIKAVLALPFWITFAYLAFIFILRAMGAIFGGGGA